MYVVPFQSIDSTAAVISAVWYDDKNKYASKEKAANYFHSIDNNQFVPLPPTDEWHSIGWDTRLMRDAANRIK